MGSPVLMYIASLSVFAWGVGHLFPTRSIVRGFGELSADNKRIVAMEWITEGVALIFIASVIAATTSVDGSSALSKAIYALCVVVLNVLSVVSLFTGFKNAFIAFKLCPFIFTGSSILIILGGL